MSSGSIPTLQTGLKYDTNATPNSIPLRDSGGGLTNGPESVTQLTCTGSVTFKWNAQTSSYAITWGASGDNTIYADTSGGNITLTLPSPVTVGAGGMLRVVRKSASNTLSVAPNGAESINGAASAKTITATANLIVEIFCDGTNWILNTHTVI